jgi:hypothetical protein
MIQEVFERTLRQYQTADIRLMRKSDANPNVERTQHRLLILTNGVEVTCMPAQIATRSLLTQFRGHLVKV